ncbi:hypothetical protein TI39_contig360g00013 [Zymoseptoria brevis]|uniref:Uncharacterized protein n=1 Tax=Zymoseptoria brevis TaxID=1047168 RepID=A0A0F4GPP6_9PEZI|nr:hypothetical protein TI39_contig360g00013 [Zymoseptoria brevis]
MTFAFATLLRTAVAPATHTILTSHAAFILQRVVNIARTFDQDQATAVNGLVNRPSQAELSDYESDNGDEGGSEMNMDTNARRKRPRR